MISDTDVTKLKKVFATKEEFAELKTGVSHLKTSVTHLATKIDGVNEKVDVLTTTVMRIENTLDIIAGGVHDLQVENGAGAAHLARHDRQIEALSKGTRIKIPN